MKRTILVTLMLVLLIPTMAFASVFQIGPAASVVVPVDLDAEKPVNPESINFAKYSVGADFRFNMLSFLQLKMDARGNFNDALSLETVDAFASANLRFNLRVADVTVGAGARATISNNDGSWLLNNAPFSSFDTSLLDSILFYHGGLSLKFKRISLAIDATVPTAVTLNGLSEDQHQSVLDTLSPSLDKTQVSVGILFNLF